MKRNDPTFKEMVSRIESGELTRLQAADTYGINPGTLNVWLSRSNLAEKTRLKERPLHGAALGWVKLDPDRAKLLDEVVARVVAGELTVTQAARENPTLVLMTISTKVRQRQEELGLPMRKRRTRAEMAAEKQ